MGEFPKSLFYLVRRKMARASSRDLSHRKRLTCRKIGEIAVGLLGRAQAVTHQKSVIHEEAEIVRLQRNAPGRLAIEKRDQLYRSRAAGAEIAHEEFAGHP